MTRMVKIGLIVAAAISSVVIFVVQPMAFPPMAMPPMSWLPAFIFLSFWDALAFGVGIGLIVYLIMSYSKWPKEIRGSLSVLYFIALWFTLLNWVHDGLHNTGAMPPNWSLLAFTEFLFHVPWLIFGLAIVLATRQFIGTYKK